MPCVTYHIIINQKYFGDNTNRFDFARIVNINDNKFRRKRNTKPNLTYIRFRHMRYHVITSIQFGQMWFATKYQRNMANIKKKKNCILYTYYWRILNA